jgi:hypothetical protein
VRLAVLLAMPFAAACGTAARPTPTPPPEVRADAAASSSGHVIADASVGDESSFGWLDDAAPDAPEWVWVDAGCVNFDLPPGLGVPFPCGDASCWSGSEFCQMEAPEYAACIPMPCGCGANPRCRCLPGCPFDFCIEDAGRLYQSCSCP